MLHYMAKKDFVGVIKLRILRWSACPGLSRWTLYAVIHIFILIRETEGNLTQTAEEEAM